MTTDFDFLADKWVRVMCDYCAEGIWDRQGASRSIDSFPAPEELKRRIMTWQAHYELRDIHEMPPVELDWEAFAAEGLLIAREIKRALPDWTVIYHDESVPVGEGWKPGMPRDHFEYEIILNPDGTFSP